MRKYSEKFLNNHNILDKAVIGLEFEFFMKNLSYYKTLEILNQYLAPVKVWGFRQYHSDFKPDSDNFKIEPDLSGGSSMVELITGPMDYHTAKYYLSKILRFISENGYTTDKSSVHFNFSFKDADKSLNDLNILKLILMTDEEEIYKLYPTRKNNVYAKSIKKIIPYKEYDFFNVSIDTIKNSIRLPNDKYYGINFLHINEDDESARLEFRYIGGKDYEKDPGQLMYFLDKFIVNVWNSIDVEFVESDVEELEEYLKQNISLFKNFSKYDNFLVEFPTIELQIDQSNQYDMLNAYYPKLYAKLFNLIDSVDDLKDCIINYTTVEQKMELVDATVKAHFNLSGYDFIGCRVQDGIFDNCAFINAEVDNMQLTKCDIVDSEITGSKLLNCKAENSQLVNCYFVDGYLNSTMEGGVFRSGKLGPWASISSTTKIVSDVDSFFATKYDVDKIMGAASKENVDKKLGGFK